MVSYLNGVGKNICSHCNLKKTKEGYDGCIGHLENVRNACCGHGEIKMAYVQFNHDNYDEEPNRYVIRSEEAIEYIKQNK